MSVESLEWFDIPAVLGRTAASVLGLSKVPIVDLDETHRPLVLAHLLALDTEDRRLRFSHALSDLGIARYMNNVDFKRDSLFGIFGKDDMLVGVLHLALIPHEEGSTAPVAAELGLSLRPEVRGHGLGTALFKRALRHARNLGVERLFIFTLMDNEPMLAIARKLEMDVVKSDGQCEAHLKLPPASTMSTVTEFMDENLAELDKLFKRSLNQVLSWADL